jgi:hypothetical protein
LTRVPTKARLLREVRNHEETFAMTPKFHPCAALGGLFVVLAQTSAPAGLPFTPAGGGSFQVEPDPPAVYDVTGSYCQATEDFNMCFTLAQDANGIVTGFGELELAGTTGAVAFTVRGVVRGVNGLVRVLLKFRGSGLVSDGVESALVHFISAVRAEVVPGPPRVISGTSYSSFCARGFGCERVVDDFSFLLPDDGAWGIVLSPLLRTGSRLTGQATVTTDAPRSLGYAVHGRLLRDGNLILLLRPLLPGQGRPFVLRVLATVSDGAPPIPAELLSARGGFLGQVVNARY